MTEINGRLVHVMNEGEDDEIQFYTDGIIYSGGSFNFRVEYVDFYAQWDDITGESGVGYRAITNNPIINIDGDGNIRAGVNIRGADIGLVRYPDGNLGLYAGASVSLPFFQDFFDHAVGFSVHGSLPVHNSNLSTYNYITVFADGTGQLVEYFAGSPPDEPYVEVRLTPLDSSGNPSGSSETTYIGDPAIAADMGSGQHPHIWAEEQYWGQQCFLAGTRISMWDGTEKVIEAVGKGDFVLSYDRFGRLVPGKVTCAMRRTSERILDVHGLMVTPGHLVLSGDGPYKGRHVRMLDLLRSDGALVKDDGSLVRASTGCFVGSSGDRKMWAVTGELRPDGMVRVTEVGQIRVGTRFINADGEDLSMLTLIAAAGGTVTEQGLVRSAVNNQEAPFYWSFTSALPKPEDYILQRSAAYISRQGGRAPYHLCEETNISSVR